MKIAYGEIPSVVLPASAPLTVQEGFENQDSLPVLPPP